MAIFNAESYQEVSLDWLRFTLKFDNPGNSKAKELYGGFWPCVRAELIEVLEKTLGVSNGELIEKTTVKGYDHILKYSNGLEMQYHETFSYMGISVELSGDTLRRYRSTGVTDKELISRLDFEIALPPNDIRDEAVIWKRHGTRVDLAIDYFNSGINVETLANKVTRTKTIKVHFLKMNKQTKEYTENLSAAEAYAHMNDGVFNTLYIGRPQGEFQVRIYNKLLEQSTKKGGHVPKGVQSWVRAELTFMGDWPESFIRSALRVHNDNDFKKLFYLFFLRKMVLKYEPSGRYHDITKDMKKKAEGAEMVQYSKAEPDDILKSKYEHIMNGSGLIGFLQILGELDPDGRKGLVDKCLNIARTVASERTMPKDIALKMPSILELVESEGYQFPF